ncbi:mitochondrial ribosomal protein, S31, partial [Cichlidogyrus casuarinus]
IGEEADVPFHEHVFLEKKLDRKSLKVAPLLRFMEMVCAGLSKNPHYTMKEKEKLIEWYHAYFHDKIPQIEAAMEDSSPTPKQISNQP